MAKLNQVIAASKSVKTQAENRFTEIHREIQKVSQTTGITRVYTAFNDDDVVLPPESTRVQYTVERAVQDVKGALTGLLDIQASIDYTNVEAQADVMVDEQVLLRDVPVTYLMFLEKKLVDIRTFVSKLPLLDESEDWEFGGITNIYTTPPIRTLRTAKLMRNHVIYDATDKHPAQVQVYTEDKPVGEWTTRKLSGAIPLVQRNTLLARVDKLISAVKHAREQANLQEAFRPVVSAPVLSYIFDGFIA